MFCRDIEKCYKEYASTYETIVKEAETSFKEKAGRDLTVFHKILIDKIADAYVCGLIVASEPQGDKRIKASAVELQKWLGMAMGEVKSAQAELQARQTFYRQVIDVVDDLIADTSLKKEVLKGIRVVVEEGEKR
jgi:hypothetical protein